MASDTSSVTFRLCETDLHIIVVFKFLNDFHDLSRLLQGQVHRVVWNSLQFSTFGLQSHFLKFLIWTL